MRKLRPRPCRLVGGQRKLSPYTCSSISYRSNGYQTLGSTQKRHKKRGQIHVFATFCRYLGVTATRVWGTYALVPILFVGNVLARNWLSRGSLVPAACWAPGCARSVRRGPLQS